MRSLAVETDVPAVVGRDSVGRLLDFFRRSSACMPEKTSSRRSENA